MEQCCDNGVTKQIMLKFRVLLLLSVFALVGQDRLSANEYQAIKKPAYGVVMNTVNVRQKPSTTFKILGSLKKNQRVRVIGWYKKQWYHVIYNNKKAWVWSKNLRLKVKKLPPKTVKKSASNLEVIKFPSANRPRHNTSYQDESKVYDRYQNYQ